jgi:hypothetical protein
VLGDVAAIALEVGRVGVAQVEIGGVARHDQQVVLVAARERADDATELVVLAAHVDARVQTRGAQIGVGAQCLLHLEGGERGPDPGLGEHEDARTPLVSERRLSQPGRVSERSRMRARSGPSPSFVVGAFGLRPGFFGLRRASSPNPVIDPEASVSGETMTLAGITIATGSVDGCTRKSWPAVVTGASRGAVPSMALRAQAARNGEATVRTSG